MQIILSILLLGLFGAICYSLVQPSAQFVVRYSQGKVRFSGKFPRSHQGEAEEFLKREFSDGRRITIAGVRGRTAGLRIVVRGSLTEGDRQQIRNFFQTIR